MKAVLLSAGYGTRLKPLTDTVPKCLVPVQSKPLLGYWLDLLLPKPIDQVLINTHYLAQKVKDFVQSSPWESVIKLVHEDVLLGTGGTLYRNRDFIKDGAFMVAHADNLTRFSVEDFIATHVRRKPGIEITMMTFQTDNPQSCGIVELDAANTVVGFHEKVAQDYGLHANAAVYIFEPAVLDFLISLNKEISDLSTEVIPHFLGRIQTYHNTDYHRDIGTVQSLALAEVEF
ncbi:MAG: nucleotidyltransferase family protein [Legionellaceae bacterium]|nr:nucleotidyltransferase family protein [Legionellaceae bacterium]MBP9774356.1 nucleotidyltransferase family protein [Legionellaceae bacterium]